MSGPYTVEVVDGHAIWLNARGEQVAHYPEMLVHGVLVRTLEHATGLPDATIAHLEALLIEAWPMVVEDSPAQHHARCACVEAFREAGLMA